jgi:hypothetical protein
VGHRGGRIISLEPTWDFPFWYSNALLYKSKTLRWRSGYTLRRAPGQVLAMLGGESPFQIIEEPAALTRPFVYDSYAAYIV